MQFDARAAKLLEAGQHFTISDCPGLRLEASTTRRSWIYRYKSPLDGKMRQTKIGEWPAMSLAAATVEWEKLRGARANGDDPSAAKRVQRDLERAQVALERERKLVETIGALDHWAKSVDKATMRATLRLPKSMEKFSMLRVVISRHYAYPLKDVALGDGTTYANWAQFYNAVELAKRDAGDTASLGVVFDKIEDTVKAVQPHEHEVEPRTRWTIDDLVFVTQQKGDGDGDSRGATANIRSLGS